MKISRREALRRTGLLLGGAISAPALAGVLGGCQPSTAEGWTPRALSAGQNDLVTTLSELILPATDTPGAEAAQVNRFIDTMLADWYPAGERERFLAGLAEVDAQCQEAHGETFLKCTPEEQTALLTRLDEEAHAPQKPDSSSSEESASEEEASDEEAEESGGLQREDTRVEEEVEEAKQDSVAGTDKENAAGGAEDGPPFFRTMKELTLLGYYTSEIGMEEAAPYNNDIIPGRFVGCLPLEESKGQPGVGGYENLPAQSA